MKGPISFYTYDEIKFLKGTFIILRVKYIYMPDSVINSKKKYFQYLFIHSNSNLNNSFQQGERNWMEPQSYLVISITSPLPVYL